MGSGTQGAVYPYREGALAHKGRSPHIRKWLGPFFLCLREYRRCCWLLLLVGTKGKEGRRWTEEAQRINPTASRLTAMKHQFRVQGRPEQPAGSGLECKSIAHHRKYCQKAPIPNARASRSSSRCSKETRPDPRPNTRPDTRSDTRFDTRLDTPIER